MSHPDVAAHVCKPELIASKKGSDPFLLIRIEWLVQTVAVLRIMKENRLTIVATLDHVERNSSKGTT